MDHCIAKIVEIISRDGDDRRDILQLGYNLGRLSELTGLGREAFWDRWKGPVADWDRAKLAVLASDLQRSLAYPTAHYHREGFPPGIDSPVES